MANRPFEVGDFLVLTDNETGIVTSTKNYGFYSVQIKCDSGGYTVNLQGEWSDGYGLQNIVKHIRTPRKGSKEARKMVFVSACYYRAKLNKRFRHLVSMGYSKKDAFESSKDVAQFSVEFDIYDEQKSMLK